MGELPSVEIVEDRLSHWEQVYAANERALEFARKQIENCHRLKALLRGEVSLILLHGGEVDTDV